jgi:hypothetical protein
MHQPCKTCPFRENPIEAGSPEWLIEIMKGFISGQLDHSCHLTDPKADLFAGAKKKRQCIGFLGMMKRYRGTTISIAALRAMGRGEIDWEKIPTKGVFASPQDCVRWHAKAIKLELGENG